MQLANRDQLEVRKEAFTIVESHLIDLRLVTKAYTIADKKFRALKGIDVQVNAGEFVAVVGKSGSGKSTLINMITGIDNPTSGEVFVASTPVHDLNQEQLAIWRGRNLERIYIVKGSYPECLILWKVSTLNYGISSSVWHNVRIVSRVVLLP